MRHPDTLTDSQRKHLERILDACPDLAMAHDLAQEFSTIARERRGRNLTHWMACALDQGPQPVQGFAARVHPQDGPGPQTLPERGHRTQVRVHGADVHWTRRARAAGGGPCAGRHRSTPSRSPSRAASPRPPTTPSTTKISR
ncbi:transposase [Streptomyces sp. SKN60]|nr:transposase [Streptomyces sp. SKN60]